MSGHSEHDEQSRLEQFPRGIRTGHRHQLIHLSHTNELLQYWEPEAASLEVGEKSAGMVLPALSLSLRLPSPLPPILPF